MKRLGNGPRTADVVKGASKLCETRIPAAQNSRHCFMFDRGCARPGVILVKDPAPLYVHSTNPGRVMYLNFSLRLASRIDILGGNGYILMSPQCDQDPVLSDRPRATAPSDTPSIDSCIPSAGTNLVPSLVVTSEPCNAKRKGSKILPSSLANVSVAPPARQVSHSGRTPGGPCFKVLASCSQAHALSHRRSILIGAGHKVFVGNEDSSGW